MEICATALTKRAVVSLPHLLFTKSFGIVNVVRLPTVSPVYLGERVSEYNERFV